MSTWYGDRKEPETDDEFEEELRWFNETFPHGFGDGEAISLTVEQVRELRAAADRDEDIESGADDESQPPPQAEQVAQRRGGQRGRRGRNENQYRGGPHHAAIEANRRIGPSATNFYHDGKIQARHLWLTTERDFGVDLVMKRSLKGF